MQQVLVFRHGLGAFIFLLLTFQFSMLGQNCPADLEWPVSSQAGPGTTNVNAVVVWPTSLETSSIITDRHPNARATFVTPTTFPPALGGSICDPAFKTTVSRVTPTGYSLIADSFSVGGGWLLTYGPGGGALAIAIDPSTGRAQLVNGQVRQIPISYEMIPMSPAGVVCPVNGLFWSRKDEGVIYIVGCGTRIFKYNLALYNAANQSAGLVAGSNARSIAQWPSCAVGICRQGPVFLNLDDLFGAHAQNGNIGFVTVTPSNDDVTFTGFLTRGEGYKNTRGVFSYRPWNNSLWYSVGPVRTPDVPFLATGKLNGVAIDKRVIGAQTDRTGRYFNLAVCGDASYNLGGCSSSDTYIHDLNTVPQGATIVSANPVALDQLSHGALSNGLRVGANGITQALAIQYLEGTPEKKLLALPNLINPTGWWGSYTDAGVINGPSGLALAAVHSTYSYETYGGVYSVLASCPVRHCLYGNELILFNTSGTRFLRVAHNQSRIQDYSGSAYWDLPRVSLSPDGKYAAFVSNWGTPSTATAVKSAVYTVRIPPSWRMLLDDTVTVNTSVTSTSPGTQTVLTVSHVATATGANVVLQDASQVAALKATSCMFQVTKTRMIQLADDTGTFVNRFAGPIGSSSAGFVENSRCRIDLTGSSVDATAHGNIGYQLKISYKAPFLGKTIRAIVQPIGSTSWTDGTKFEVKNTTLTWSTPAIGRFSDSDEEPTVGPLTRSNEALLPGSSLEFPLEDPQPFQLSLSDDSALVTLRVSRSAEGAPQFEVLQDTKPLAVVSEVKAGSLIRVDYRMVSGY